MICPQCGKDAVCSGCGYSEPDLWMRSHHDFETEVALADNVKEWNPELFSTLQIGMNTHHGVCMYRLTKPTPNAPSGRVVRILETIYRARGNTFSRPKHYTERRDSDKKTLAGWKSAHRIRQVTLEK